eukprot:NODE_84_length_22354_cov_0.646506.p21 type:complete len:110 gc:universal NODE_84_length_22354_cov_0.646506:17759-18088(+)
MVLTCTTKYKIFMALESSDMVTFYSPKFKRHIGRTSQYSSFNVIYKANISYCVMMKCFCEKDFLLIIKPKNSSVLPARHHYIPIMCHSGDWILQVYGIHFKGTIFIFTL